MPYYLAAMGLLVACGTTPEALSRLEERCLETPEMLETISENMVAYVRRQWDEEISAEELLREVSSRIPLPDPPVSSEERERARRWWDLPPNERSPAADLPLPRCAPDFLTTALSMAEIRFP